MARAVKAAVYRCASVVKYIGDFSGGSETF